MGRATPPWPLFVYYYLFLLFYTYHSYRQLSTLLFVSPVHLTLPRHALAISANQLRAVTQPTVSYTFSRLLFFHVFAHSLMHSYAFTLIQKCTFSLTPLFTYRFFSFYAYERVNFCTFGFTRVGVYAFFGFTCKTTPTGPHPSPTDQQAIRRYFEFFLFIWKGQRIVPPDKNPPHCLSVYHSPVRNRWGCVGGAGQICRQKTATYISHLTIAAASGFQNTWATDFPSICHLRNGKRAGGVPH